MRRLGFRVLDSLKSPIETEWLLLCSLLRTRNLQLTEHPNSGMPDNYTETWPRHEAADSPVSEDGPKTCCSWASGFGICVFRVDGQKNKKITKVDAIEIHITRHVTCYPRYT